MYVFMVFMLHDFEVYQSSVQNLTFLPSRMRFVVLTAHIFPHIEQV